MSNTSTHGSRFRAPPLAAAALILACSATMAAPATTTTVLTSAADNKNIAEWSMTSKEAHDPSPWSVRKKTLHGGKQEGVEVIVVNNGKLSFTVVPTRGMSIYRVDMGDVGLGWKSPVKQLVNPAFINLDTRGGLGWLDGFNEWMVRCGIEWAGHPGLDDKRMLTLHGKVGNIPASEVRVVVEHGNPTTIRVRGRVDEKSMFGANLELWTEISTQVGSNTFAISDEVRNTGSSAQEFQIIYHANHGAPLLEGGARFVSATKEIRPLDGVADRAIDDYAAYKPPVAGFHEEVFGLLLYGDASNRTTVMLHNAAANKGVTMTYSLDELPYFNLWKNTGAAEDAYVTGLEPATGYPANRSIERAAGRVPQLQPGQSRRMSIEFALLDNAPAVAAATAQIEALAAGRPPRVNHDTIKPRQD